MSSSEQLPTAPPEERSQASRQGGKRGGGGRGGSRKGKHSRPGGHTGSAAAPAAAAVKKVKEEVLLVVSLVATGRSPLNGWVLSLGAVAIEAQSRRVLALFSRNLLPLLPNTYVEPAVDVAGYLRKQRAELALFYRGDTQVSPEDAMRDLKVFCEPYANLTLVGSPLLSVYGWLSYYWTHVFPASDSRSAAPAMPWGFSGVCARSYASGFLGVPVKKLSSCAAYQASCEGFQSVGIPVADALVAAVSFSHLYWLATARASAHAKGEGEGEGPHELSPVQRPPPVSFACEVPALLAQVGCIPATTAATSGIRWCHDLPSPTPTSSSAAAVEQDGGHEEECAAMPTVRPMLACVIDKESILDGLEIPFASAPSDDAEKPSVATTFAEYPSITDSVHHPSFLERLPPALVQETTWVATEKVHGSNLTLCCDGSHLWAAKRTGYLRLKDSASFFDYVFLMEEARPALMKGYHLVLEWLKRHGPRPLVAAAPPDGIVVAFMCELAGGVYPHPNVPVDIRGVRVQNGVYYSPKNFLYGFDIAIELGGNAQAWEAPEDRADRALSFVGQDGRFYLPFDDASAIFEEAGFEAYARALHRGSLAEMLSLPVEFPSTIATQQLGLPAITIRKNEAEGFVVRPVRDAWVRLSGGAAEQWVRAIIKRKHPRFDEFASLNNATSLRQQQVQQRQEARPNDEASPVTDLTQYLTAGRVESVLSKYTEEEQSDHARMVAAVLADALQDAKKFSHQPATQPQ